MVRVRVVAPRLGNAALKVQTHRAGTVEVNSHATDARLAEVVRSEVGPYQDPLFALAKEIPLEGSRTETIWISVFTPEGTRPGIYPGAVEIDAGRQKLKLPFTWKSSLQPCRKNKGLGNELALVRTGADGEALSATEVQSGSLLENTREHRADDGGV